MTPTSGTDSPAATRGRKPAFKAQLRHQPAYDGLRGTGVFLVMASHNGFLWAKGGFLWVSVFFTLSAFLITSLLMIERERTGTISLRSFWARRFRRLMPAALLTLVAVAVFGLAVAEPTQLQKLRGDGIAALFYVANWHFIAGDRSYAEFFNGLAFPSPVQHFWTLSIEEQFYITLPLIVVGLVVLLRASWAKVAAVVGVITVASFVWLQVLVSSTDRPEDLVDRMYFGTDTRLPELTVGVLLAIFMNRKRPQEKAWVQLLLAVLGPMALAYTLYESFTVDRHELWLYRGGLAAQAVLNCVLVAAAAQQLNLAAKVLSFKPIAWLGVHSYGAYLFHWPIFLWLDQRTLGLDGWPLFAVRLAIVLPLAWASNKFFEHPIRVGARLRSWRAYVVAPLAVVGVVAALVAVTIDPPESGVDLTAELTAAPTIPGGIDDVVVATRPPGNVGPADPTDPTGGTLAPANGHDAGSAAAAGAGVGPSSSAPSTTWSNPSSTSAAPPVTPAPRLVNGPVRMLMVGDSQAYVIGRALERWSQRSGGTAAAWNQSVRGCGIVRGGLTDRMGTITSGVCEEWPDVWGKAIAEFRPHVVVVLSGGWDWNKRKLPQWPDFKEFGDPVFDQHITDEYGVAADLLSSKGAIVVWLTAPCYSLEGFGQDPRHLNDPIIADMVEPRRDRVAILDLFAKICPGGEYTDTLGGLADARPDGSHLSDAAADWLVSTWLAPELLRITTGS